MISIDKLPLFLAFLQSMMDIAEMEWVLCEIFYPQYKDMFYIFVI